ncbi:MAG: PASTA domain-containing protein [Clostridia bacterium]
MIDVIGKTLTEATNLLTEQGYIVKTKEYTGNKQTVYDSQIVIRQTLCNKEILLVYSNLLTKI